MTMPAERSLAQVGGISSLPVAASEGVCGSGALLAAVGAHLLLAAGHRLRQSAAGGLAAAARAVGPPAGSGPPVPAKVEPPKPPVPKPVPRPVPCRVAEPPLSWLPLPDRYGSFLCRWRKCRRRWRHCPRRWRRWSRARFDADYLQNPKPKYPALSRRLGEEGKVVLRVRAERAGAALSVVVTVERPRTSRRGGDRGGRALAVRSGAAGRAGGRGLGAGATEFHVE